MPGSISRRTPRPTRICASLTTRSPRKSSSPEEYEQWLENEIGRLQADARKQKLGIKVNCFAVPYGNINDQVREVAMKAGYEAVFTVYGQRLTMRRAQ